MTRDNIITAPIDDLGTVDLSEEWRSLFADHNYNYEIKYATYAINQKTAGTENSGYHVCIVETTRVPLERADLVEDTIEIPVCACKGSFFHHGPEDANITVEDTDPCKHAQEAFKQYKASEDEHQSELIP